MKKCETCEKTTKIENYSYIIIDTENNTITCGVKGIVEGNNIRILNNKVVCAKCEQILYINKN
jgi:hypothetical protein